jgi:outer membrane protein assembly factor BamB
MAAMIKTVAVFSAAVCLVCPVTLDAQVSSRDWPQWRGPTRDGSIPAFTVPAIWPERLTLKWTIDVGLGHSTPVVVGDRVYMFSRIGGDEVLAAFDAASGTQVWRSSYPAPYTVVRVAMDHGAGPKSTPVFAGGKIFTIGISGILSAFDAATGKRIWQEPAPPAGPTYTTSQSPIVDRGLLIVHVGGYGKGALTAFDPETGARIWQWTGDGPAYGSPIVADFGGTRQVITFTENNLVGVSAETGDLLWSRPFHSARDVQALTPLVYRDTIIVSAFESGITAIRILKQQGAWVTENAWKNDDVYCRFTNGVIVGDALFSLSGQSGGRFFFVDARTGAQLWRGDPRTAENAAISKAGDLIFALKDDGELIVLNGRNPTEFAPIGRYQVSNAATWSQPAIVGNRLFVKDVETLALWTFE